MNGVERIKYNYTTMHGVQHIKHNYNTVHGVEHIKRVIYNMLFQSRKTNRSQNCINSEFSASFSGGLLAKVVDYLVSYLFPCRSPGPYAASVLRLRVESRLSMSVCLVYLLTFCVSVCGLFNNVDSCLYCVALNDRTISE